MDDKCYVPIDNQSRHNDNQPNNIGRFQRLMSGSNGQGKSKVTQRDHDGHGQPQDVGGAVLQDHDDEDVVEDVEAHVESHVEWGHVTVVHN